METRTVVSKHGFPIFLLTIFLFLFVILSISPYDRSSWILDVIPGIVVLSVAILIYMKYRFSNISCFIIFIWLVLHTIGIHYTYSKVPIEHLSSFFGFHRNNFDRVAHFAIGLYSYPIMELLVNKRYVKNKFIAFLFALSAIGPIAAGYEIIEWLYSVILGGNTQVNLVASQGDVWDAQKDMSADFLGALLGCLFFSVY